MLGWMKAKGWGLVAVETFLSVQAEVPSKPVVRPYRPPTAQEVCYQRIQLAQQQAAQLAVAVQKASLSLPGEKRRIAHVPNVAISAAVKQSKPAAILVIPILSSLLLKRHRLLLKFFPGYSYQKRCSTSHNFNRCFWGPVEGLSTDKCCPFLKSNRLSAHLFPVSSLECVCSSFVLPLKLLRRWLKQREVLIHAHQHPFVVGRPQR